MVDENVFLLHALCLGLVFVFVYDILVILRKVIKHYRFWIAIQDLAFWIFCAVAVFLLMHHESSGTLRWFAILGALVGMILYKKTLSRPFVKYVSMGLMKIKNVLMKPFSLLKKGLFRIFGTISQKQKRVNFYWKKKLTRGGRMLKMVFKKI
ncbi:MAG: spore cortex biosynthesis protein YabQ [Lachnospiraceae bacterium]|jgi:spore cortex biosynthesis protein YabQ|nr:spore cortex biosynthesis protein YabQ [Lachnospiraceae bacterium]